MIEHALFAVDDAVDQSLLRAGYYDAMYRSFGHFDDDRSSVNMSATLYSGKDGEKYKQEVEGVYQFPQKKRFLILSYGTV